jgi:hypothetical protein
MNDLSKISNAVATAGDRNEQARMEHSKWLEDLGAIVFESYEQEGHGMGWFAVGDSLFAYRKYSNGYSLYPTFVFPITLLREIVAKLPA